MAVNDTATLSVIGTVAGQQHVHTLSFRSIALIATEQALIDEWQATCRTAYRQLFGTASSPCTLYRAAQVCGTVPLRAPAEEAELVANSTGTKDGGISQETLPPHDARVVSLRTAFAGKSRRGRNYLGGVLEVAQIGGVLQAGFASEVTAYYNALMTQFGPSGASTNWQWVIHSHKLASGPSVPCQDSSTPVTGFIVRTQLGTMRSRRPGSGA